MSDVLERLREDLAASGGRARLSEVAPRLLATGNAAAAARVLGTLVERDPRFRLEGETVALAPEEDPFAGRALCELAFAVLDFETNGLTPGDRAIEVGVVVVEGGREVEAFETLLDPGTPVSPFVTRLTGIRKEDLVGRPSFPEVWPSLERLLRGRVLVAHNLPFDRRILRREVALLEGDPRVGASGLCTVRLSRRLHPSEESHALDAVALRHGFTFRARHRALDDARVTAGVLLRLLEEARDREGLARWEELQGWLAPGRRQRSKPR